MKPFRHVLNEGSPLLFDGAMGTELYRRGLFINRSFEEANLGNRQLISEIHRDYLEAGADVLSTNSWGAGFFKLKEHNLQEKVYVINLEAAKIAREVAQDRAYVAGSIGPLGQRLEPWGTLRRDEAFDAFKEQVRGLRDGGADFILFETFGDIKELGEAIRAAKAVDGEMPIVSCISIELSGEMEMGPDLATALGEVAAWGSDAVGLNCHIGPQPMLGAIKKIKGLTNRPLIVQPNAGLPKEVDGRTMYMSTPEYFAEYTKYFLQEGVQFVGGCCGTTPDHVKAMAQSMRQFRAMSGAIAFDGDRSVGNVRSQIGTEERVAEKDRLPFANKSRWSEKIARGQKVYTIELVPPLGIEPGKLLENAAEIKKAGIDAINIPDGPRASSRMSAIVTAILIEQKIGIETILHYTCRDRNLIGMQADMLGAHAIGLRNVLLLTGDPPKLGNYPNATGVFDVDAIGLVRMVHSLNGGFDIGGKAIGEPTALSLGVGVNPAHQDFEYEMGRFEKKIEAGAEWAVTQPVFDVRALDRLFDYMQGHGLKIPLVVGIWPLTSLKNARFMKNEVPGVEIPDELIERMAKAESLEASRSTGIEIAREMCAMVVDDVSGIQLSAPFGRIDLALRVIGKL